MRRLALISLLALSAGCGDDPGSSEPSDTGADITPDVPVDVPDVADALDVADVDAGPQVFVPFEIRVQDEAPTPDTAYASEETTRYRPGDGFPEVAANTIAVVDGEVWAGTTGGLTRLDWNRGAFAVVALSEASVLSIAPRRDDDGNLWVGTDAGIASVAPSLVVSEYGMDGAATGVAVDGSAVVAAVGGRLWQLVDGTFEVMGDGDWPEAVGVVADGGRIVAGGASGTWEVVTGGSPEILNARPATGLAFCPDGTLVATTDWEVRIFDGEDTIEIEPGPGALPTDRTSSAACSEGWMLFGHAVGASAMARDGDHIDHYQSGRWLLGDEVNGVALDGYRRWFATLAGVTRVDGVPRTIGAKAEMFLDLHDRFFWRLGGFSSARGRTDTLWSFDGMFLPDDDNDGQWTEEMIAALVYAYGATGDDRYCAAARPAVNNMLMEFELPCITFEAAGLDCGFITRSFVRDDEGAVFDSKATQENWHLVEYEGHEYYWKDDTSSDEYAGHYYGLPLYFDHCASDGEKERIATNLAMATDYLVANDYALIDLDGEPTTDGVWTWEEVASCVDGFAACRASVEECATACYGGGFTNSTEILGHLLATWHVTGDQAYYDEYVRLRDEDRYGEVVVFDDNVLTALNPTIENHVDHELGMLAFHTLIRYEPDPTWRATYQDALVGLYESELDEENPFWAAVVAGLAGMEVDRAAALESLREYPLDTRHWGIDHTHRLDYTTRPEVDRFGNPQLAEWPPPYDEQPIRWWDGSPYQMADGGDGRSMRGPMAFSVAYWAARYYGLLGPPERPDNPHLGDDFLIIAHRGGGALAPESTLEAYANAAALGADVLECDVHATSDGVLVCMHDDTVDRTTDGTGRIKEMTFDELRALDAGYDFSDDGGATHPYRGTGVVVPTLAEALAAHPDAIWTLEVKQNLPPIAREVVKAVEDARMTSQTAIGSFLDDAIAEVRAANPDMPSTLTASEMLTFVNLTEETGDTYDPPGELIVAPIGGSGGRDDILTEWRVEFAHGLGMRFQIWTINDRDEMVDLIGRGADAIITDDPALLLEVVEELGLR